ncbi:MAG TPA: YkgJ family cysteine cluster protein [Desulfobacterales bacterium]|nr:YkgJ family cysteine cluster protein [Desulfobacterales bacterium]
MTFDTCRQCGTCCRKGGPILHHEDLILCEKNILAFQHLITIREQEPVFSPLSADIEPAPRELIKLSGINGTWTCLFFKEKNQTCGIYQNRPLECRALKCWDTGELERIIYRHTLSRRDIIAPDKPIWPLLEWHNEHCQYGKLAALTLQESDVESRIAIIINDDLSIRQRALTMFNLNLAEELFYFGRPMFKALPARLAVRPNRRGGLTVYHKEV